MLSTSSGDELGVKEIDDLELTVDLDEILSFKTSKQANFKKPGRFSRAGEDNDDLFDDFVNGVPRKQSSNKHDEYSLLNKTANSSLFHKGGHDCSEDEKEFYENIINYLEEAIDRERQVQRELKRILGK